MDVLLHKKLRKAKIKAKENFCNADADANISKWSKETIVSNLGTKIQVEKIESERYSVNILKLSGFLNGYTSVSL